MAVLKSKGFKYTKKQMTDIIKKIEEGKYKFDHSLLRFGTNDAKPIKDKDGILWKTCKRNFNDSLTIEYIDIEAKMKTK